jgi:hypothetical protein
MGAPTSPFLAEIFIQFLEHNQIHHILSKHNIIECFRCVDDTILIVYSRAAQLRTQGGPHYSGYMSSGASTSMIIRLNLFQRFSNCGTLTTGGKWSILR